MSVYIHSLSCAFGYYSASLQSRYENFIMKKSKKTKEAAKLREYITTVERSLQACEVLQAVAEKDSSRRSSFCEASKLTEVHRFSIHHNKVHVTVSFLLPIQHDSSEFNQLPPELQAFYQDEMVISIVDDVKKESILVLRSC